METLVAGLNPGTCARLLYDDIVRGIDQQDAVDRLSKRDVSAGHEENPEAPKVLMVEDDELVQEFAAEMLSTLGWRVDCCESGEEASAVYAHHAEEYSLVILDMILPGIGGRKVFERMRAINPDVKVLICSGYARGSDVSWMLDNGAMGFLAKPYRVNELSEKLNEILASREVAIA